MRKIKTNIKNWWIKDIREALEESKKHNRTLRAIWNIKKKGKATENEYDIGLENLQAAKKQINNLVTSVMQKEDKNKNY